MIETCKCCGSSIDEELKAKFASTYPFVLDDAKGLNAILFQADCASSGLTIERLAEAAFCPHVNVLDYGYYKIRGWWVWTSEEALEKWTIGPGGFFRDRASKCHGAQTQIVA